MTETTTTLAVADVSCDHCKQTIEGAVGTLEGAIRVEVDVARKSVTVVHDAARLPVEQVASAVEDQGYEVEREAGQG